MTVLFIMLLHGVPVYLIGILSETDNIKNLRIAAGVSAIIALLTGNPAYILADFLAIFVAMVLAHLSLESLNGAAQSPTTSTTANFSPNNEKYTSQPQTTSNNESMGNSVKIFIFLYILFNVIVFYFAPESIFDGNKGDAVAKSIIGLPITFIGIAFVSLIIWLILYFLSLVTDLDFPSYSNVFIWWTVISSIFGGIVVTGLIYRHNNTDQIQEQKVLPPKPNKNVVTPKSNNTIKPKSNNTVPPKPNIEWAAPRCINCGDSYQNDHGAKNIYDSKLKLVQKALKKKGYYTGEVTGQHNPGTERAIRNFQKSRRIPSSGELDFNTLRALRIKAN